MRTTKILLSLLVLALAVAAAPAFADGAPVAAALDTDQGALFAAGQACNQTTCGAHQFCCNYSCSICAPIGGACTQQYCPPVELSLAETLDAVTLDGSEVPTVTEPAEQPAEQPAQEITPEPQPLFDFNTPCNQAVCGPGEFCCNYSCSTCTPKGSYCTQQYCPPTS
jgi:hypothetical protein